MKNLARFSYTGSLEVYHSLLNKWVPNSTHFSYEGMIIQTQPAAVDFNLGNDLEQKTTKMGKECFDRHFQRLQTTGLQNLSKLLKIEKNFTTW